MCERNWALYHWTYVYCPFPRVHRLPIFLTTCLLRSSSFPLTYLLSRLSTFLSHFGVCYSLFLTGSYDLDSMDWRPEHGPRHDGSLPTAPESAERATSATPPLSERIGTSTRALLRNTILRPSPQSSLDTLASISSRTEKGGSSSSVGSTSVTEASSWRSSSASCDQTHRPSQVPNETFRTSAIHDDAQMASSDPFNFDDFLAGHSEPPSRNVEAPFNMRGTNQLDGKDCPKNEPTGLCLNAAVQRSGTDHAPASNNSQIYRWHSESWQHDNTLSNIDPGEDQCDYDGAEVVALLSVPGSCLDEVPADEGHRTQSERLNGHPHVTRHNQGKSFIPTSLPTNCSWYRI